MADEPSGIVMQSLRRVRSHPVAIAVTVIAVSAVVAVFAGGGAGQDGTQRVRTVADEVAAQPTTRPDGVAPTSVPVAADAEPLGTPVEAPVAGPANVPAVSAVPAVPAVPVDEELVAGDATGDHSAAPSSDSAGGTARPSAPRSWSDRIFFSQESIVFEQPSAVWSVARDGGDPRIEARGLLNGPGDQFTEGARLGFDVSPDRSTLLYSQYEAVPYWDVWRSEVNALRPGRRPVRVAVALDLANPRFAPDGQSFVVATENEARVMDLQGNVLRTLAVGADFTGADDFGWSPSGDRIALALTHGPVEIIDVASGLTIEVLPITNAEVAWSPDGTTLALSGWLDGVGGIHLFDTTTWGATTVLHTEHCSGSPCSTTSGLDWTPDGRRLVVAGTVTDGALHELDLESGDLRLLYQAPTLIYRPRVT